MNNSSFSLSTTNTMIAAHRRYPEADIFFLVLVFVLDISPSSRLGVYDSLAWAVLLSFQPYVPQGHMFVSPVQCLAFSHFTHIIKFIFIVQVGKGTFVTPDQMTALTTSVPMERHVLTVIIDTPVCVAKGSQASNFCCDKVEFTTI